MVSASISSRSSGLPPWRHSVGELVERAAGLVVLANAERAQRFRCRVAGCRRPLRRTAASWPRSCQLASQWCMPVRQYGSSSCAVTTGVMPRVTQVAAVLVGQRAQHPHQRQVGRRPRLVEPFLADRPATVVCQPRQVGVQDEGEHARDGVGRRLAHGRTAIATRSRLSSISRARRRRAGRSRRCATDGDVGQQVGRPRRVGHGAGDLRVDDRAAVAGVELGEARRRGRPRASPRRGSRRRSSSSVSSAAFSSRVWNGLIGVSRPGEKVIRLGVDISSTPAGPQHASALGDELSLIPQVFDDLEVDHHVDRRRRRSGSSARLPWRMSTRG